LGIVQVGFRVAQAGGELVVVGVADQHRHPWWWGHRLQHRGVGRGQGPVVPGPCGQDAPVGFLLGGVGDQPGRVVVGGGVRVVGVEVEVHPGVAEVVLLPPPRTHPVDDLFG